MSDPQPAPGAGRLEISATEHSARRAALRGQLEARGLTAMLVSNPARVAYLSGFHYAATERPIVLVIAREGPTGLLIPRLETDHVRAQSPSLKLVLTYPEYPGGGSGHHPLESLKALLESMRAPTTGLAADHDGYEARWGYRGPRYSTVFGQPVLEVPELIDDLRAVKSPAEVALIEEACRWGDHAHDLMVQAIKLGSDELVVSHNASLQATRDMLNALGERYAPKAREGLPANTMFISGRNTANPHGLHEHRGVQPGDVLVTGAYGIVGGYESELERTMIFGAPDATYRERFAAMLAIQDAAFSALRPGRTCADFEREITEFIDDLGLSAHTRHHTGHAFGLEGHEAPFLDLDDHTPIREGMIFSLEPGLYYPGQGGYRHSDTVLVTQNGCRALSHYPRQLDELIVQG